MTGKFTVNGTVYFADDKGVIEKGWVTDGNDRYYILANTGLPAKGKTEIDGEWYNFDPITGIEKRGWNKLPDGYWYHFDKATGKMERNGWFLYNGYNYYANSDGHNNKGFATIDTELYYFSPDSAYAMTGKFTVNGTVYFANSLGVIGKGWVTDGADRYYFIDGVAAKGKTQIGTEWYNFNTDTGVETRGWNKLSDGYWYFFDKGTGIMERNGWFVYNGNRYYANSDGHNNKGLTTINGEKYYFSPDGAYAMKGKFTADGKLYIADSTGLIKTGWITDGADRYYADPVNANLARGKTQIGTEWYNFNTDTGVETRGWNKLSDGYWYFFDKGTGIMERNGWFVYNGNRYYANSDGHNNKGLTTINGEKYYFSPDGAYAIRGWAADPSGFMLYGDLNTGVLKTGGPHTIDGKPCFFTADGKYIAPPTIHNVLYKQEGGNAVVTITATSSKLTSLHAQSYSWDGGATWVNSAVKSYPIGTKIPAGTLRVRDASGNVTIYGSDLLLTGSGPYYGIDVSAHQGPINWAAVKNAGVDFAIVRAMTWSNAAGYYVVDPYFEYNVRNAKAQGIRVGAYIFTYAFNNAEMDEEIYFFHNEAMKNLRRDGIKMDFPVYVDFEYDKVLNFTSYDQRTVMVRRGMVLLEQLGYKPGFYSNQLWHDNYFNARALYEEGYDYWFARYPANPVPTNGTAQYIGYAAPMWQYASDGRVPGISGNVDMNICFKDYGNAGGTIPAPVQPTLSVYNSNGSGGVPVGVTTGTVSDIVAKIVANEVKGFNNAEVYRAQAVAAYSWVLYQEEHDNAVPSVGLTEPNQAVRDAVNSVAGQALYYNGVVANAAYGSASGAMTNRARNMWGLELPYLNTPVPSPETNWRGTTKNIPLSTMSNNIAKLVGADVRDRTPRSQWITNPSFDENGYLTGITICGQRKSGGEFYENCWLLYSPKFTMTFNGNDTWTFRTDGNGHCVGMSQYGANIFAVNSGWNYRQILAYYFPGTNIA